MRFTQASWFRKGSPLPKKKAVDKKVQELNVVTIFRLVEEAIHESVRYNVLLTLTLKRYLVNTISCPAAMEVATFPSRYMSHLSSIR